MLTHATSPAPGAAPPEEKVEVTSVVSGADAPPGTFPEPTPGVLYAANFGGRSFVLRLPLVVPSRIPVLAEDAALPPGLNAELAAILDLLDPARPGRVPFPILIEGAAATGKTALAMSAMSAAQARGWFPGGFLLASLRAQGRDIRRDIREVVTRLLQALQVPPEHLPVATTDRIELYQGVLAAYAADNRRVLVFFDEAPDSVQMRLLLPADDKTEIIVTSLFLTWISSPPTWSGSRDETSRSSSRLLICRLVLAWRWLSPPRNTRIRSFASCPARFAMRTNSPRSSPIRRSADSRSRSCSTRPDRGSCGRSRRSSRTAVPMRR